jgi:carbon-monoxide dehydrogenase small subunit
MKKEINIKINGDLCSMRVDPGETLLAVLRDTLHLTGVKNGCNRGECGTCTVLLDGRPVRSCILLAVMADGHEVETIEGLESPTGEPSRIQEVFVKKGAIQCGFCTPGMILTGKSLLDENPDPSESEVRRAISGNLCRCTGYAKIVDAIRSAGREGS